MSLRERRDIVDLCGSAAAPLEGVLFSVVQVRGSSYRQPGARMVQLGNGRTAGTISGGCLEADLLRRAGWLVRGGAVVVHFSTAFDDTADVPYGLGCGGEIDVLVESLGSPEAAALLEALQATLRGEERVVATVLVGAGKSGAALCRVVLDARGDVLFASEAMPTEDIVAVRHSARQTVAPGGACLFETTAMGRVFLERLRPVQRLVIFGAGEDARPLARLAAEIGWQPVVVDTRSRRLAAMCVAGAICVEAGSAAEVPVCPGDAAVLMTHSYGQDRALLTELLTAKLEYLGLLGARHRSALLLQEASTAAQVPLHRAVALTHAPVGLDLGGEGPEAVALAIVAEVQQVLERKGKQNGRRLDLADVELLLESQPTATLSSCALDAGTSLPDVVAQ